MPSWAAARGVAGAAFPGAGCRRRLGRTGCRGSEAAQRLHVAQVGGGRLAAGAARLGRGGRQEDAAHRERAVLQVLRDLDPLGGAPELRARVIARGQADLVAARRQREPLVELEAVLTGLRDRGRGDLVPAAEGRSDRLAGPVVRRPARRRRMARRLRERAMTSTLARTDRERSVGRDVHAVSAARRT